MVYLMRSWVQDQVARIRHPWLVRDHVPVEFLARAYTRFAVELLSQHGTSRCGPSGFAQPLAGFARRLANAMRPRLKRECEFASANPPEPTDEPLVRRNRSTVPDLTDGPALEAMWDSYAAYWTQSLVA
jgi:hypothetical protein